MVTLTTTTSTTSSSSSGSSSRGTAAVVSRDAREPGWLYAANWISDVIATLINAGRRT